MEASDLKAEAVEPAESHPMKSRVDRIERLTNLGVGLNSNIAPLFIIKNSERELRLCVRPESKLSLFKIIFLKNIRNFRLSNPKLIIFITLIQSIFLPF